MIKGLKTCEIKTERSRSGVRIYLESTLPTVATNHEKNSNYNIWKDVALRMTCSDVYNFPCY